MSMIEVADSDVMNMLVDMCNVESTLLIHDKTEARHIMNERTPRNARAVSNHILLNPLIDLLVS